MTKRLSSVLGRFCLYLPPFPEVDRPCVGYFGSTTMEVLGLAHRKDSDGPRLLLERLKAENGNRAKNWPPSKS